VISRRQFVVLGGFAVAGARFGRAGDEVPSMLDHILLGCSDLDQGIAFVEQHTGVRAAIGGVHPGRGTRNALLSLGERRYLEIIAPDPAQKGIDDKRLTSILKLSSPSLIQWAAHVDDIEALAKKLKAAGVNIEGPAPGSRKRPDGRLLQWKTLGVDAKPEEVMPFFIEWGKGTVHPSVDAPSGCRLENFSAGDNDPAALRSSFRKLGLEVPVYRATKPELHARIVGPKGTLELKS
jgi:hypothetical protein